MKPPVRLQKKARLAPLSTFRIGRRAARLGRVRTPDELISLVRWAKKTGLPCRVFAGGSNIVFPDRTLGGLLVQIAGGNLVFHKRRCIADAGVPLAEVIDQAIRRGLQGLETLSGIPGTVGGAVVGNAGAYGHSISEAIRRVEVWDGARRRFLTRRQCRFEYRESIFKKKPLLLLRVMLQFRRGNTNHLRKISRGIVRLRLRKYRPGLRCPGSFFKNVLVRDAPKASLERIDPAKIIEGKIPAGYLLEQVGAKGMRVGGVVIAPFHGNLFINRGGATARDVRTLARILKRRVSRRFGIHLEEEIRYF